MQRKKEENSVYSAACGETKRGPEYEATSTPTERERAKSYPIYLSK